jgi:multidrug efflux pump subunit AcrA (membrane-fusion protein)
MRKIILILLLLSLLGGWIYYYLILSKSNIDQEPIWQDVYYTVSTWDIINSIKVMWTANLIDQQTLKFDVNWNVIWVYVSEGQIVKKWQILAELDTGQLRNEIKEAKLKLENAHKNLDNILDKFENEDKVKAIMSLEANERRLQLLKRDLITLQTEKDFKIKDELKKIEKLKDNIDNQPKELHNEKYNLEFQLRKEKEALDYKISNLDNEKAEINLLLQDAQKSLENKSYDYYKHIDNTYKQIWVRIYTIEEKLRLLNKILQIDFDFEKIEPNYLFSVKSWSIKNNAERSYSKSKVLFLDLIKIYNDKNNTNISEQD